MQDVAAERGGRHEERRFGEMLSFELAEPDGRRISFQIALRDIPLDPPQPRPWMPILIETLRDNLASKMIALVNRGAPRDMLDIHMAVTSGLVGQGECWQLWSLKNPGQRIGDAKAKTLLHLENLEQRRPLSEIHPPNERARAEAIRQWFRREFLKLNNSTHRLSDEEPSKE